VRRLLAPLVAATALAACGGEDRPPPDPPPVRLTIVSPSDAVTVQGSTIKLIGRVSPARASVEVAGEPAAVDGGSFEATVQLEEGANVIDVAASMPGRSPAFAAVRVTHDPRVEIPDLIGVPDEEAADRLVELGLDPTRENVGSLFDEFRSGERRVCESEPPPGTLVDPGAEVRLLVAKRCG
jgi:Glucodextranase, domain B/PASTA domain